MSRDKQIVQMYKKGLGATRIGHALGVHPTTVYDVLEKCGVERRDALSYDFTREWRKLRKKWKHGQYSKTMRVLTLPRKFIEEAGFDAHAELEGKWEVSGANVILHIREVKPTSPVLARLRKVLGGDKK